METKKQNPWIAHLNKYRVAHPELKGKEVIQGALTTYQRVSPTKKDSPEKESPEKNIEPKKSKKEKEQKRKKKKAKTENNDASSE